MSQSQAPAYARTGAPLAAGPIITIIANRLGLTLSVEEALGLAAVAGFAYYCLGRALESYNPKLGYVLGIAKQPAYSHEKAPAPNKDEDLVAVVVPEGDLPDEGDGQPEQTDNGPRGIDPAILPPQDPDFIPTSDVPDEEDNG